MGTQVLPKLATFTCGNCGHSQSFARSDIEVPTPPFHSHQYASNEPIKGIKLNTIRDSINLSHTHISTLDDDMRNLEAALTELRRKREGFVSYIAANQESLSPFKWFPTDILMEIFMYFMAGWGSTAECSIKNGPLAITGICRHWRNIALETPLLWSSIPIVLGHGPNLYHSLGDSTSLDMLTTWLYRAQSCPLSITLRARHSYILAGYDLASLAKGQPLGEILDALIKSCHQWQNVYLQMTAALHERLSPVMWNIPNLQSLSLSIVTLPPKIDIFQNAIHLSSLTYVGNLDGGDDNSLFLQPLRWSQLRHLDCKNKLWLHEWLNILPQIHNLETATLHISFHNSSHTHLAKDRSIHLMGLRDLAIVSQSFTAAPILLNYLCTPALKSFEIAIRDNQKTNCAPALSSFLSQCPDLYKLILHFPLWVPGSNSLTNILRNIPQLRELVLHGCDAEVISAGFIDAFAVSAYSTPSNVLMPALISIAMEDSNGPEIDMLSLIDSFRTRVSWGLRDVLISRTDTWISAFDGISLPFFSISAADIPPPLLQLGELRERWGVNVRVLVDNSHLISSGSSWKQASLM